MDSITLVGMPASGKSTVGKILAKELDYNFLDIDDVIRDRIGMEIADFIEERGEEGILLEEEEAILSLSPKNLILAPGGSCIYSERAMEHLKKGSTIIYLRSTLKTIEKRIGCPTKRGVIGSKTKTLDELYVERTPHYEKWADFVVESEEHSPKEVAKEVLEILKK